MNTHHNDPVIEALRRAFDVINEAQQHMRHAGREHAAHDLAPGRYDPLALVLSGIASTIAQAELAYAMQKNSRQTDGR